ncbi:MAG: TonB-dependent receptor [Pseudohongiellaceae bacterium]
MDLVKRCKHTAGSADRTKKRRPGKNKFITTSVLALTAAIAQQVSAQQNDSESSIEEITVTGSFIQRTDNFELSSPVDVLNSSNIEERGTPNLGEVIRQQSFNYGVDTVRNNRMRNFQGGTNSQANLRGLGEGATLTLANGRRTLSPNLQSMYPQIALDRVETLTDGGAALYGTDAVAGVVNIIPRTQFEGIEVRGSMNSDTRGSDWNENTVSVIVGGGNGRTNFTLASEFRDRDQLKATDRPEFSAAAIGSGGDGMPGSWIVPVRNEAGEIIDRTQMPDPGCGKNNFSGTTEKTDPLNNITGVVVGSTCRMQTGMYFEYVSPQTVSTTALFMDHRFDDMFNFEGELTYSLQDSSDVGSPSNSGGNLTGLGTVPGTHPGNPFRAMADRGNGMEPIFATDADGDGIPDRDESGAVVVASNPFDSSAGVPFNEDVDAAALRVLGKFTGQLPGFDGATRLNSLSELVAETRIENVRWAARLNIEIPDSTWTGYIDYTSHHSNVQNEGGVESLSSLRSGLNGRLHVREQDVYFNPFSTQLFECVNRNCEGGVQQSNPAAINTTEVFDAVAGTETAISESNLNVLDVVFTGNTIDLPAGPLGLAVGSQWRHLEQRNDFGSISNARDSFRGTQLLDWAERRTTFAGFAEVDAPLLVDSAIGSLSLNAAVRHETGDDSSNADLSSTDWKAGLRWGVTDWLSIRGSAGTSFIAPSLSDLFAEPSVNLSSVVDPLREAGTATQRSRTTGGNPNLESEEAESYNLGFTASLLDGDLTFNMDWKIFQFEDRIVRPTVQEVVDDDFVRFNRALNAGLVSSAEEWMLNNPNLGGTNPDIGETSSIQRNPDTLLIQLVDTPLTNAREMEWEGADVGVNYRFDSINLPFIQQSFGQLEAGLSTTYLDSYKFRNRDDTPLVEGAGKRNANTGFVPPAPRWRGTARLGWVLGQHSATLLGRYTHHVEEDDGLCNLGTGTLGALGSSLGQRPRGCTSKVASQAEWDLQYTLSMDGMIGNLGGAITVGAINIFDTLPYPSATFGGMETFLYDPRGRQVYARFSLNL